MRLKIIFKMSKRSFDEISNAIIYANEIKNINLKKCNCFYHGCTHDVILHLKSDQKIHLYEMKGRDIVRLIAASNVKKSKQFHSHFDKIIEEAQVRNYLYNDASSTYVFL
jgi:CO dehydrogenase nickel-insertion accessory protein CooC1